MWKAPVPRGVIIEDFPHLHMPSLGMVFDRLGDALTIDDMPPRTKPRERADGQRTPALWGPLGPGNLPATIVKITDWAAPGLTTLAGRLKADKVPSTWSDLKQARELGAELGHRHRHPMLLATSLGLVAFRVTPTWLAKAARPACPGYETTGLIDLADKKLYFDGTQSHQRQLETIAHECGHYLKPEADEQWCDVFSKSFIVACAASRPFPKAPRRPHNPQFCPRCAIRLGPTVLACPGCGLSFDGRF